MKFTATLLAAVAPPIGVPSAVTDMALPGIEAEAANDVFAACYEPKLANDPVIKSPIEVRAPFEALDNPVSNEAMAACQSLLKLVPLRDEKNPEYYKNRLIGLRFLAMRNTFYVSRGAINLETRRRIRPYLACIETNLSFADLQVSKVSEIVSEARETCQSAMPQIEFSGSETERQMREQALSRYANSYALDILAFKLKTPFKQG